MKASIEALFQVKQFSDYVSSHKPHPSNSRIKSACVMCLLQNTLKEYQRDGKVHSSFMKIFFSKLKMSSNGKFKAGCQEDAHEFCTHLLQMMSKKDEQCYQSDLSNELSNIECVFGGSLRTTIRCTSCSYESITKQPLQELSLDIRNTDTVEQAVDLYFSRERLTYSCDSCKNEVAATKQFSLECPPASLRIHLKRYTANGGKLNNFVSVPKSMKLQGHQYKLVSALNHFGTSFNGHYTTVSINQHFVQSELDRRAYMLFYEKV